MVLYKNKVDFDDIEVVSGNDLRCLEFWLRKSYKQYLCSDCSISMCACHGYHWWLYKVGSCTSLDKKEWSSAMKLTCLSHQNHSFCRGMCWLYTAHLILLRGESLSGTLKDDFDWDVHATAVRMLLNASALSACFQKREDWGSPCYLHFYMNHLSCVVFYWRYVKNRDELRSTHCRCLLPLWLCLSSPFRVIGTHLGESRHVIMF